MSLYHGRACAEDPCDYCQDKAEEKAAERDDDPGLAPDFMDNRFERELEATWP